jgi:small-conductance mechanosensitive channel
MSVTPALLVPWYWQLVRRLQGAIDTRPKQYLATVALPIVFLGTVFVIYLGGKSLKQRFTSELVEIARTLTIMAVALVDAVLFVIIWRWFGETMDELDAFGKQLVPTPQTAVSLYIAFIALLGTYMLTRVTKRVIRYWSKHERISPHQRELAHHLTQISLFLVVVVFIFGLFGVQASDLFLGAGALGVVLGLAARQTLANLLSGLIILFGRPFEAGDWIRVGEREGIVTDITVFNTQVRTFNEEHQLIPNDQVTSQHVINYSKTERLRLTTDVGIDYDDDVPTAATIAKRTMESCESVADSPSPDVVLESFGDSEVVLRLRYWIDRPTIQRKLSAQNEVIEGVKAAFEAEGVKIPFPQRELLGREETDGLQVGTPGEASVADDERIERAVRGIRDDGEPADATAVSEPVEAEYAGDGESDDTAGESAEHSDAETGSGAPEGEGARDPAEAAHGDDGRPTPDAESAAESDDGDGGEADDGGPQDETTAFEDIESAAQLVEDDEADLSSPHPRERNTEVYPVNSDETVREPVEDDTGRRQGDDEDTSAPTDGDDEDEASEAGESGR